MNFLRMFYKIGAMQSLQASWRVRADSMSVNIKGRKCLPEHMLHNQHLMHADDFHAGVALQCRECCSSCSDSQETPAEAETQETARACCTDPRHPVGSHGGESLLPAA